MGTNRQPFVHDLMDRALEPLTLDDKEALLDTLEWIHTMNQIFERGEVHQHEPT